MSLETFKWAKKDDKAWASQAVERNGKWHWYICCNCAQGDAIGIILGVSAETVKTHSKSIQVKLDAPNTAGAVSRAYELGILRP